MAKPPIRPMAARIAKMTPGHRNVDLTAASAGLTDGTVSSSSQIMRAMIENTPVSRPQRCISDATPSRVATLDPWAAA